jgi:hypothetical protein
MALLRAFIASGLLICYALFQVKLEKGIAKNALLAEFLCGPRGLAKMAIDFWVPRRFAMLSKQLTIHNGILLLGAASIIMLF